MSKALKFTHRKSGGGTSVEEYGVNGEGKFNQTLKIQRALDQFQHAYFPPGTYLVDGSLTASLDKQTVMGAAKGTVIKMMGSIRAHEEQIVPSAPAERWGAIDRRRSTTAERNEAAPHVMQQRRQEAVMQSNTIV